MKYLLLLFAFMLLTSCKSQNEDILFINRFLNELKQFDESKYNELSIYLEVDTTRVKKEEIIFWSNLIKDQYTTNKYEVMSYKDFKTYSKFKEYNCIYPNPNFENVYGVVFNDSFSFIILNENKNKIISFYSGLIKVINSNRHQIILN